MSKIVLDNVASGYDLSKINANFQALQAALDNTLSRDGTTPNTVEADIDMNGFRLINLLAQSGDGFIWYGPWVTATAYAINALVSDSGNSYICVEAHTSGATFANDLAAGKWEVLASKGASGAGSGDLVSTNNLSDVPSPLTARANLGLAIGVNVQAYSADTPSVAASEVEMQTGTEAALRSMSPLRVAQAIAALAPSLSAADVLALLLTVDGSGSGLDADTVRGAVVSNLYRQAVSVDISAATGSTSIPLDNTTPLISEGTQVATLSITPSDNTNLVEVTASFNVYATGADGAPIGEASVIAALFRGSTCISVQHRRVTKTYSGAVSGAAAFYGTVSFNLIDAPASASAVNYSIRVGRGSGTSWATANSGLFAGAGDENQLILKEIIA